jgi:group I intron endonuclease
MNKAGIYKIENIINNKVYIGQSVNVSSRKSQHWYALKNNKHGNTHLQNAWNKYGEENFIFKIILYCEQFELTRYEKALDKIYKNNSYNIRECVDTNKGIKHDEEFKKKISESQLGRKRSELTKSRISEGNRGKPLSEERKGKISKSLLGNVPWNKGIPRTKECKEKISKSRVGDSNHSGNKNKNSTSKYIGVYYKKSDNRWYLTFKENIYFGGFHTEVEAAMAYNEMVLEIYGWKATINKIDYDDILKIWE